MPYEILAIGTAPDVIRGTLADLTERAIRDASAALDGDTVWIVPPVVREGMNGLTGLIDDRGHKHPAIELARLLLKGDGPAIPLITANYNSAGKLLGSVRTLLRKAVDNPRRLFIVAVADDLFSQLWRMAREPELKLEGVPRRVFRGPSGAVLNLLEWQAEPADLRQAFLGGSADALAVRQLILLAGKLDHPVLITGDTGTGKEIVARQIHAHSRRRDKPLRAVNCGAFPPDLLESELFGHVRGAFTGAITSSDGLWLAAKEGTLFLDEIGELSPGHQVKLLRALQENKIRKVGATDEIDVDARVICATNRDLYAMVQAGQFREDLYYRLRGFLITTTPLREHRDDVRLLADAFWKKITQDEQALLAAEVLELLCAYSWPGNIRELKTILTTLFGLFGNPPQPLGSRHLQGVFEMHGVHLNARLAGMVPQTSPRQESLSAFRQLRQVYETLRALEHRLSSLLNDDELEPQPSSFISTTLRGLLNELVRYTRIHRLFSPRTFENIGHLCSWLDSFLSQYQTSPQAAVAYLRTGIRPVLDKVIADVLADIDRALTAVL